MLTVLSCIWVSFVKYNLLSSFFAGTMLSGQARLLFSSAQVEYIRYWLHAMGLTKTLLPLPSSDYLLNESSIRNWSPVIYRNAAELKKAMKVIYLFFLCLSRFENPPH